MGLWCENCLSLRFESVVSVCHCNLCLLSVRHQDLVEIEFAGGYHPPVVPVSFVPLTDRLIDFTMTS